jgi:CRISPR-associated endonuclease/helicase Cas3
MSTNKPFQLRPFQERVLKHVLHGESVILQAPTGAGKTRAALAPFIQNLARGGSALPYTCRYAVPMRVLANQFYRDYQSLASSIDKEALTRLVDTYQGIKRDAVSIQTGEQSDDPQMESALTFCTIDQLLASFLGVPYGVDGIRANLNVGAVIGSYLLLDEFHLYPLLRDGKSFYGARTTTIEMLRLLKSTTPFVLMTATFSTSLLNRLKDLLGAQVEAITDEDELKAIAEGRTRTFELANLPMNAEAILNQHDGCSLAICNTVLRAQELFLQLKARVGNHGPEVILLHSRFETEQRKQLSQTIEHELGPQQWQGNLYHGQNLIVVATQVVEVGLDISVHTLHTEIAPANSLIQRAGRCARFRQQQGRVIIYPLPSGEDGKPPSTLPYSKETCDSTWTALEDFHGKSVAFTEEQKLINAVHTPEDIDLMDRYERNRQTITSDIFQSFNTNKRSIASTLIRDVLQVPILIHDNPDEITTEPWRWQSFGMHPGSLAGHWKSLQERKAKLGLDWMCKQAIAIKEDDPDGVDNRQKITYLWQEVTNPDQLLTALIVVMPSQLASYYQDLGFVLLDERLSAQPDPSSYQSTQRAENKRNRQGEGAHRQSYQEHIKGLVDAYNWNISKELRFVTQKLEHQLNLPAEMIDQAIRLAIACHDLGKLDCTWQQWAREWQQLVMEQQRRPYQPSDQHFFFAKTDYDYSPAQRELQKNVKTKRPHHACESVMLGRKLIATSLGMNSPSGKERLPLLRAICGAIARHHTTQASNFGITRLDTAAIKSVEEAFKLAQQNRQWEYDLSQLSLTIPEGGDLAPESKSTPMISRPASGPTSELETWLYFVIVRALRLADQRAGMFS